MANWTQLVAVLLLIMFVFESIYSTEAIYIRKNSLLNNGRRVEKERLATLQVIYSKIQRINTLYFKVEHVGKATVRRTRDNTPELNTKVRGPYLHALFL